MSREPQRLGHGGARRGRLLAVLADRDLGPGDVAVIMAAGASVGCTDLGAHGGPGNAQLVIPSGVAAHVCRRWHVAVDTLRHASLVEVVLGAIVLGGLAAVGAHSPTA